MLIRVFSKWAFFFLYYIIYKYYSSPKNTLLKIIKTQAQNRFSRESIFTRSARSARSVNQHDDTLRFDAWRFDASHFYVNNAIYIALLCILPYLHSTPMQISRYPNTDPRQQRPELFCECPNMPSHRFYRFFRV